MIYGMKFITSPYLPAVENIDQCNDGDEEKKEKEDEEDYKKHLYFHDFH